MHKAYSYDANDNLLTETDYKGNTTSYRYDAANRRERITYPSGDGGVLVENRDFDGVGNVIRSSINGRVTRMDYDNLYRVTRTTNPLGDTMVKTYDGNGNILSEKDEEGRVTQNVYDNVNRRISSNQAGLRTLRWEYDDNSNIIKAVDGKGQATQRTYDARNRLTEERNALGERRTMDYDAVGNLLEENDHYGRSITHQYDDLNRRKSTQDRKNETTRFGYDSVGNMTSEQWPNGNSVTRTYNLFNQVLRETDSLGDIASNTYDDNGNLKSTRNGRGYITRYSYDDRNQRTQENHPEGRNIDIDYDVFGNVTSRSDGRGNDTVFSYDALNRLLTETDADNHSLTHSYDGVGNKISTTNQRGFTTTWDFDDLNRMVKQTDPQIAGQGNEINNVYDNNDNLLSTTDKRGLLTENTYDAADRLLTTKRNNILVLTQRYNDVGDLVGTTDANGNATAFEYDARNQVILESRPLVALTRYTYDAMGDLLTSTDPEQRVSRNTYDKRRRLLSSANGAGETTSFGYDANNNKIFQQRPNGNQWNYAYDQLDRLIGIEDALGQTSSYDYDAANNLIEQIDANGNTTTYAYNDRNLRVLKTYPEVNGNQTQISVSYDEAGNRSSQTDGNGVVTTYAYDALNRLTSTVYQNGSSFAGQLSNETQTYDGNNNLLETRETYQNGDVRTTSFSYDNFDRLFNKTDSFGNTLGYRYDLNGNRTQLIDSLGTPTNTQFDALNRPILVTNTLGQTRYSYDRSSLLTQTQYPNNTTADTAYDDALRKTLIENRQNNALVSKFEYQYDANGNRSQQTETNGASAEITTYAYDDNDRLKQVAYPDQTVTYTYDAAYNRIAEQATNAANATVINKTLTYNARNQLVTVTDHLDATNNIAYQYDGNGNQIQKQKGSTQSNFIRDVRNDLRQVTTGGSTVGQFLYDTAGLRIEKIGERGTERSLYDDQSILQQYNQAGNQIARFDYGAQKLLSLTANNEPAQFYLTDALNSVVNLTNNQGAVQARYQYDAWGKKRNETGNSYNRFGFTGYEEDKETGLYYAKARYYDPDNPRFLSEDAWAGDQMIAPSLHKYLYVYQNPTVYIDPTGNSPEVFLGHEYHNIVMESEGLDPLNKEDSEYYYQRESERAGLALMAMTAVPLGIEAGVVFTAVKTLGWRGLLTYEAQASGLILAEEAAAVATGANLMTRTPSKGSSGSTRSRNSNLNTNTGPKTEVVVESASDLSPKVKKVSKEEINIDTGTAVSTVSQNSPVRHQIKDTVKGKQMVMTKTAEKEFDNIVDDIAGQQEKARAARFKEKVKIINDDPSDRAKNLKVTKKVGAEDKIIFGTGDKKNITTVTADGKFVRGAEAQGVEFDVEIHNPVPLKKQ